MEKLKLLLLQLPLCSHDYHYNVAHLPLAIGSLHASLVEHLPWVEVHTLDPVTLSCGGDQAIVRAVSEIDPQMVGVSCALWNIERSLWLVRELRRRGMRALFIAGGPEVQRDNTFLSADHPFDVLVQGDGEEAMLTILRTLHSSPSSLETMRHRVVHLPTNPRSLSSPYLTGVLTPSLNHTVLIEASRGCVFRCAYCQYHHGRTPFTPLPLERITEEIRWARERGVRELIFTDPSFTARKDIGRLLDVIASLNTGGQHRCSDELNASQCTPYLAKSLARAGFRQVEVGLQSINPRTLKAVGRPTNIDAFTRGVRALRDAGIAVMVDLIVGLPDDTAASVIEAVTFCIEQELADELSIYPLSILPGTSLRREAAKRGIVYDIKPPYYLRHTPSMNEATIQEVFATVEEITGVDYFPPDPPVAFFPSPTGSSLPRQIVTSWTVSHPDHLSPHAFPGEDTAIIGQSLSIYLGWHIWWSAIEELHAFARRLTEHNPFLLLDWIVPETTLSPLSSGERLRTLEALTIVRDHPLDREWFSPSSRIKSCQTFVEFTPRWHHERTLLWVPPEVSRGQRRFLWFLTTLQEDSFPEELMVERAARLIGVSSAIPYRITSLPSSASACATMARSSSSALPTVVR